MIYIIVCRLLRAFYKITAEISIDVLPSKNLALCRYFEKNESNVLQYCKYLNLLIIALVGSHVRRDSLLRSTYVVMHKHLNFLALYFSKLAKKLF